MIRTNKIDQRETRIHNGRCTTTVLVWLFSLLLSIIAFGQAVGDADQRDGTGGKKAFEVAAIRPDPDGGETPPAFLLMKDDSYVHQGGLFHADCFLMVYIEFAYKYRPTGEQREALLARLPKWVSSEAFAIDARTEGNPTNGELRSMMQSLLTERFHLAIHFEERTVPVFALVLEKPGFTRAKLRPHAGGPSCFEDDNQSSTDRGEKGAVSSFCHHFSLGESEHGQLTLRARDASMEMIANFLRAAGHLDSLAVIDRPVIDETGLKGTYDFTLEWAPGTEKDSPEAAGDNLFEALKEQLGFRLKPAKAPIHLPVIDHIEKPTAN
jgi:uncharacterized protein (TIGR03435 family)